MKRRALHIICGVAVLFASILYVHVFHHVFFVEHQEMNAPTIALAIVSFIAGVFCFVGAYLLLTGGRQSHNPN
jgi:hypothetical protein